MNQPARTLQTDSRPGAGSDPSLPVHSFTVIGIGNSLLTDDGVGIHVIARLAEDDLPDGVELIDGGTLSFGLLDAIEDTAHLIVVDAAELDSPPGTVKVFRDAELEAFLCAKRRPSVHEVNLLDVLGAARLRGRLPPSMTLVAIQPASVAWGESPSARVDEGAGQARRIIHEIISGGKR